MSAKVAYRNAESIEASDANAQDAKELQKVIKQQIETHFSRDGLAKDTFLVTQMDAAMFVPIDVLLTLPNIRELTNKRTAIVDAIRDSTVCLLNESEDAVKPNIKPERNTIILRDIPSQTDREQVKAIFDDVSQIVDVRSDVGDTWFVTFASEQVAVDTLLALRSKTFLNAPIKARLKSENLLKSYFAPQKMQEKVSTASLMDMYNHVLAGRYYQPPPSMQHEHTAYSNQYDVEVSNGYYSAGTQSRRSYTSDRSFHGKKSATGKYNRHHNDNNRVDKHGFHGVRTKSNSFDQKLDNRKSHKRYDRFSHSKYGDAADYPAKEEASRSRHSNPEKYQAVFDSNNFPPLQTCDNEGENCTIRYLYAHEDILEIVKHMDEKLCQLEDAIDYQAHSAILTPSAHTDLLRTQRTFSIEQAREALRQGRPIRSESIGSIDYESMMYGEEYTKVARANRPCNKSQSEAEPKEAKCTAPCEKPKVIGYASAVIHGTPAPVPTPKPTISKEKSKECAKPVATKKKEVKKDKSGKKHARKALRAGLANDLPSSGAWGDRNFSDVVKAVPLKTLTRSEPTVNLEQGKR